MKLLISAVCGLLSLVIEYVIIYQFFSLRPFLGTPDFAWITLRILLPAWAVILLLRQTGKIPSGFIWFGLLVQYFVLFVFADHFSEILRMPLDGLGGFEYIFDVVVFPFVVTLVQFIILFLIERLEKKKYKC